MSRQIDVTRKLTDDEVTYLQDRGRNDLIQQNAELTRESKPEDSKKQEVSEDSKTEDPKSEDEEKAEEPAPKRGRRKNSDA